MLFGFLCLLRLLQEIADPCAEIVRRRVRAALRMHLCRRIWIMDAACVGAVCCQNEKTKGCGE